MSLTYLSHTLPFINISEENLAKINELLSETPLLSERERYN